MDSYELGVFQIQIQIATNQENTPNVIIFWRLICSTDLISKVLLEYLVAMI